MATFVLVHGAYHGGWCWSRVADRLRSFGHIVFAPSLSGLAENGHRLHVDITHGDHIEDVTRVIEWNDLQDVILVGHSYGGLIATGTSAGRARSRIKHMVVLDGSSPRSGQSMIDIAVPRVRETFISGIKDGLMALPSMEAMGVTDPADIAWVEPRLTPQPARTFLEPLVYDESMLAGLPKTFIRCAGVKGERGMSVTATRVKSLPDWTFCELATGHDAMVTMPDELTALLIDAAGRAASS
jgi:pimeloyl-ACP methyl ester carboxylesterase